MSDYELFNLWPHQRQWLIERHKFYMEQAEIRLIGQFNDISGEADKAGDEFLSEVGRHFDPDRHDPSTFYEAAYDKVVEHYQMLTDIRDKTMLSIVAGIFHEWDKQLRDWMVKEINHWHRGENVRAKIWEKNFIEIIELLAGFGWDIRSKTFFQQLDACRLVVNVYKHGNGNSFGELKNRYPKYLKNPFLTDSDLSFVSEMTNYSDLVVTVEQIREFSAAILTFWNEIPDRIYESQIGDIPGWFEKAWLKDRAAKSNS